MDLLDIPGPVRDTYHEMRVRPDGVIVGAHRLLYHWTLHVDLDGFGYGDRWCFATYELAVTACREWDGQGEPEGWHRHPKSDRHRDPETGQVWRSHEPRPRPGQDRIRAGR